MQTLNEKNIALRKETLSRRHRETECGPVKVGDVVLARNIGTYFGYIDCVLICTAVVEKCARFSGYTDDGNLVGQYRWNADYLKLYISSGTLTILDPDSVGLLLTLAEAHADDANAREYRIDGMLQRHFAQDEARLELLDCVEDY